MKKWFKNWMKKQVRDTVRRELLDRIRLIAMSGDKTIINATLMQLRAQSFFEGGSGNDYKFKLPTTITSIRIMWDK